MKKTLLFTLLLALSLALYAKEDCLTKGTSPESTLKDTNFDELQGFSMNIKNKLGGPEKGFYVEFLNKCKVDVNMALALGSWGNNSILGRAYYEPLLVQGWWNIGPESKQRVFFDRMLTKTIAFHARSSTGLVWGKDTIQYTIPGPDGGKAYPFIEYETEKKCKADENNVVTCSLSIICN